MLRRILLFIGITLVAMLLIIVLATRTVFLDEFSGLERSFLEVNLARVENAVFDEIADVGLTASDWAMRDDAVRLSRLGTATLINHRLDLVLSRDLAGHIVLGATFDPAKGARLEVARGLKDWLAAHPMGAGAAEGIIPIPEGPLMAAIRPIGASQQKGPARGTLLIGRFLDREEVNRLSRNLRLSIAISSLSGGGPAGIRSQPPGALAFVDESREDVVAGSGVLRDITGSPALLLTVELPRDIHLQGVRTLRYFILWLVVIGVVFGAVVLIVVQVTVLTRLQQLSAGVLAIGTGGEAGRRVSAKGRDQIAYLGAAINGMLEALEGSHERLKESERRNKAFLDAIPDLILRVARDGTVLDARLPSRSGFDLTQEALTRASVSEIQARFPFLPEKLFSSATDALAQALGTGLPVVLEFDLDAGRGTQHFQARIVASGDSEAILLVRDVTAEKRVEEAERRETLVKEIHHRVKNNLQVISSLLGLQASAAGEAPARAMLEESRGRVRSMALIHDRLYQMGEGPGAGYSEYVRELTRHLLHSYMGESAAVTIAVDMDDRPMTNDQAMPVGLIINELLSNALAHAFPQGRSGHIRVGMTRSESGMLELTVRDDGIGFPKDLDYRNPSSLGLRIVNMLVQQIRGTLALDVSQGTTFLVTFPVG